MSERVLSLAAMGHLPKNAIHLAADMGTENLPYLLIQFRQHERRPGQCRDSGSCALVPPTRRHMSADLAAICSPRRDRNHTGCTYLSKHVHGPSAIS